MMTDDEFFEHQRSQQEKTDWMWIGAIFAGIVIWAAAIYVVCRLLA